MVEICRNSSLINKDKVIFAIAFSLFSACEGTAFCLPLTESHVCGKRLQRVKADPCQKEHPDSMESSSSSECVAHARFLDLPLPLDHTGSMPLSLGRSREYVC